MSRASFCLLDWGREKHGKIEKVKEMALLSRRVGGGQKNVFAFCTLSVSEHINNKVYFINFIP